MFPYRFTALVTVLGDDNLLLVTHCLPVPPELALALKSRKLRRLTGSLNGQPFNLALHGRAGEEERFLLLSRDKLRTLKVRAADPVTVVCQPDEAPDHVALPEELHEVLAQEPEAATRFYTLTPGRQRGLAHYVASAKGIDTRIKRALELAYKLRTHTLYGDVNPEKIGRAHV